MPKFADCEGLTWGFTPGERSRARAAIERLQRIRAERAALDAEEAALLAEVTGIAVEQVARIPGGGDQAFPLRSMAAELALAVKESPRAMQARMDEAYDLRRRFPATCAALAEGRITHRHARAILAAGSRITDDAARARFEAEIVAVAATSTPQRTRIRAVTIAERHDPVTIADRHHRARADRTVWVEDLPDGMAELRMVMPAVVAYAVHDRLTTLGTLVNATAAPSPGSWTAPTPSPPHPRR